MVDVNKVPQHWQEIVAKYGDVCTPVSVFYTCTSPGEPESHGFDQQDDDPNIPRSMPPPSNRMPPASRASSMQDLLDSDVARVANIVDGPSQAGAPQLTQRQQQQQWQQLP